MTETALYTYWRSSATYRVRIALNLKGVDYRSLPVHLARDGGEHRKPEYLELNPEGLVPAYVEDGQVMTQSLSIIEYLEETHPAPALLPTDARGRARVRGLAQMIACDIHPIANLRVLQYLTGELGVDDRQREDWVRHWIRLGFRALEARLAPEPDTGTFCHGDDPGLADACLVPQVYNAVRFRCDMGPFPTIVRINDACLALDAFSLAVPEAQADCE